MSINLLFKDNKDNKWQGTIVSIKSSNEYIVEDSSGRKVNVESRIKRNIGDNVLILDRLIIDSAGRKPPSNTYYV